MTKKKVKSSFFLIFICGLVSAASGFTGANLTIDNGKIEFINTNKSIYIGEEAGNSDATDPALPAFDAHNVGIGRRALYKVKANSSESEGTRNTCGGGHCMHEAFDADRNACLGTACLYGNVSGKMNFAGGYHAGAHQLTDYSVLIGAFSEENNEDAYMSVTIGTYAARYNQGKKNFLGGGNVASNAIRYQQFGVYRYGNRQPANFR